MPNLLLLLEESDTRAAIALRQTSTSWDHMSARVAGSFGIFDLVQAHMAECWLAGSPVSPWISMHALGYEARISSWVEQHCPVVLLEDDPSSLLAVLHRVMRRGCPESDAMSA